MGENRERHGSGRINGSGWWSNGARESTPRRKETRLLTLSGGKPGACKGAGGEPKPALGLARSDRGCRRHHRLRPLGYFWQSETATRKESFVATVYRGVQYARTETCEWAKHFTADQFLDVRSLRSKRLFYIYWLLEMRSLRHIDLQPLTTPIIPNYAVL